MANGYLGNPGATAATVDGEGWIHTGDLGRWVAVGRDAGRRYDEEGDWYITDRLKELIKVKGFQVAPAELEAVILSLPGVQVLLRSSLHHTRLGALQDAGVVGVADEAAGEVPRAFVVRKPGEVVTSEEGGPGHAVQCSAVYVV
jgi:acyl-CoA synthetase (AMP-forming)/AMP-acid ligase II